MSVGPAAGARPVEVALDAPAPGRLIEAQKLGRLAAFRAGPVHPIAVAGIERAAVAQEVAQFRAAHEAARRVPLPGRVGDIKSLVGRTGRLGLRLGAGDDERRNDKNADATRCRKTEIHSASPRFRCQLRNSATPLWVSFTGQVRWGPVSVLYS